MFFVDSLRSGLVFMAAFAYNNAFCRAYSVDGYLDA